MQTIRLNNGIKKPLRIKMAASRLIVTDLNSGVKRKGSRCQHKNEPKKDEIWSKSIFSEIIATKTFLYITSFLLYRSVLHEIVERENRKSVNRLTFF